MPRQVGPGMVAISAAATPYRKSQPCSLLITKADGKSDDFTPMEQSAQYPPGFDDKSYQTLQKICPFVTPATRWVSLDELLGIPRDKKKDLKMKTAQAQQKRIQKAAVR
jgi:hypothetical protein